MRENLLFTLVAIMGTLPLMGSVQSDFIETANKFARDSSERVISLLFSAAAIDPNSGQEIMGLKKEMEKKHRELSIWFKNRGNEVKFEDCVSDRDKNFYSKFRNTMANRDFLRLSFRKRRKFINSAKTYFEDFEVKFSRSLNGMMFSNLMSQNKNHSGRLLKIFSDRMRIPIDFELRFFNLNQDKSIGALYLPENSKIFLNLNLMVDSPAEFFDSFQHEIWHHLLPIAPHDRLLENLWWEGFTEAAAEIWEDRFNAERKSSTGNPVTSIQYPVQTAFASFYLGLNRSLTLRYLTGDMNKEEFVHQFLKSDIDKEDYKPKNRVAKMSDLKKMKRRSSSRIEIPKLDSEFIESNLRGLLADQFVYSTEISGKKEEEIENLLSNWGWKEENQGKVDISRFLKNGWLNPERVTRAFYQEKQLIMDLIEAVTVINIRKIAKVVPKEHDLKILGLPPHLTKNIARILSYSTVPKNQFLNR